MLLVVLQHDHFDDLPTRIVAPLLPSRDQRPLKGLNPGIFIEDSAYHVAADLLGTATRAELGSFVTSIAHQRDEIIRALDLLFTGV